MLTLCLGEQGNVAFIVIDHARFRIMPVRGGEVHIGCINHHLLSCYR